MAVQKKAQRKMVALDVSETSGVDHPAHMHEGWVVMKSASPETVENIFNVDTQTKGPAVADEVNEDVEKASQAEVDKLKAENAKLKKELDEAKAQPFPTKKNADGEEEEEDILKSVPEAVRKMLADRDEEIRKNREDFEKERNERLDEKAITKSRGTYKALAFDHDKVAPALRRIAEENPDLATALEEAMGAADGQLESAGIFQELGETSTGTSGSADDRIDAAAQELVDAGTVTTKAQGIAKALQDNPALFAERNNEKAGK